MNYMYNIKKIKNYYSLPSASPRTEAGFLGGFDSDYLASAFGVLLSSLSTAPPFFGVLAFLSTVNSIFVISSCNFSYLSPNCSFYLVNSAIFFTFLLAASSSGNS